MLARICEPLAERDWDSTGIAMPRPKVVTPSYPAPVDVCALIRFNVVGHLARLPFLFKLCLALCTQAKNLPPIASRNQVGGHRLPRVLTSTHAAHYATIT